MQTTSAMFSVASHHWAPANLHIQSSQIWFPYLGSSLCAVTLLRLYFRPSSNAKPVSWKRTTGSEFRANIKMHYISVSVRARACIYVYKYIYRNIYVYIHTGKIYTHTHTFGEKNKKSLLFGGNSTQIQTVSSSNGPPAVRRESSCQ